MENNLLYFDRIPTDVNREILNNITDFNSFDNLYSTFNKNINMILNDEFFWKNLINCKIGDLVDYIIPLENKHIATPDIKFYYRLGYYMRVINSYDETIKTFNKANLLVNSLIKEHFVDKTAEEIKSHENDVKTITEIDKNTIQIIFINNPINDMRLIFDDKKYMKYFCEEFGKRRNLNKVMLYINTSGYYVQYIQNGMVFNYNITKERFLGLLFHIYFNGDNKPHYHTISHTI